MSASEDGTGAGEGDGEGDASDRGDEELLAAWRKGDKQAGATLIRRYLRSVDRFLRNKVDEHHISDLLQRTVLACLEFPERYVGRKNATFKTYLLGIAYHVLLKHYHEDARLRLHERLEDLSIVEMGQTPSQVLAMKDDRRRLLEAMRRLPFKFQVVIELRFWEGLKQREIAEALGLPTGTVSFRIRRGLQLLRELLREDHDPLPR